MKRRWRGKSMLTDLQFDNALVDPLCEGWFRRHLRCSRRSFLEICCFLRARGIVFANAAVKQRLYEKKVAAALDFQASVSGFVDTADAIGITNTYVIDIINEVVRVLYEAADDAMCFSRDLLGAAVRPVPNYVFDGVSSEPQALRRAPVAPLGSFPCRGHGHHPVKR
ncbi:hypothetical protein ON010_g15060 [Phytophthora cinnamomi]|nr:hypothetical protein ON010_g15060 [Phytophthora cinnamomi]